MKDWVREPLLHFLALGAGLFVLFSLVGRGGEAGDREIVIDAATVARLKSSWELQWRRPPTDRELEHLIESHIREEILYREALALGLDGDDTIVRRRLVQKMEFLSQDLALPQAPEPEEIEAYFETHRERYRAPARISFRHVYLSTDRRGEQAAADAERLLTELERDPEAAERAALGDRFMLQKSYAGRSQSEIAQLFGRSFAEKLFALEPGGWQGPIASGYGLHLIRIQSLVPSRPQPLAAVEERVRNDYVSDLRNRANEDLYADLRRRYSLRFEDRELEERVARLAPSGSRASL